MNTTGSPTPPSLPPPLPSFRSLIITAYVFSFLTIIPLLGFITGLVGILLGSRLCAKGQSGHGTANIAISGFLLFIAVPVTVIAILTLLGNQLKEIFSQVTADLATPPSP
jgi:hypothetical protein